MPYDLTAMRHRLQLCQHNMCIGVHEPQYREPSPRRGVVSNSGALSVPAIRCREPSPPRGMCRAPTTIGSSGPNGGSPSPRRAQCSHTETRIVKLQNHQFWAREECVRCGKFLRWPKQPALDVQQLIAAIKQAHRPVPIQGSSKQIRWATKIRHTLITRFQHCAGAAILLESVHHSGWFIANRNAQRHQDITWPALRDIG
jgi:hypothetical protein